MIYIIDTINPMIAGPTWPSPNILDTLMNPLNPRKSTIDTIIIMMITRGQR